MRDHWQLAGELLDGTLGWRRTMPEACHKTHARDRVLTRFAATVYSPVDRTMAKRAPTFSSRDFTLHVPRFVTMPLVNELIERAQRLLQPTEPVRRLMIDASDLELISPVGLAVLSSIVLLAVRRGLFEDGYVTYPRKTRVKTYLSRMNFGRLLRVRESLRAQRSPRQNRFRELIEVANAEDGIRITEQMGAMLKRKIQLSDPVLNNTMYCLSELLENVVHHAESVTNGVTCAQAYGTSKAMEMAIVDCGIGVRASLAKNPKFAPEASTHEAAVTLAVQRGVTSTPGRNTGEGLFFVAELLARTGRMRLHSGDALLVITRRVRTVRHAAYWPGTIVGLRFELKRGVPIREIFDQYIPLEEEPTLFPLDDLGNV